MEALSKPLSWEVSRVAGESRVEVLLDEGSARVMYSSLLSLRGFERLVFGRRICDVPFIASRICGVCSHPHFWAATLAVEQIAGIEVSEDTAILRDVCNKLGILQNHAIQLGVLAAPDYLTREDSERLSKIALELNSYLSRAIKLVCGRLTSPNNYSHGKFLSDANPRVLSAATELLKHSRSYLEDLTERVLEIELPELKDPAPNYAALRGSMRISVPRSQWYYLDTQGESICVTSRNYRELFEEIHNEYSGSKKCLLMGSPFHVGPRARLLSVLKNGGLSSEDRISIASYEKLLEENPYSNLKAKALELRIVMDSLIHEMSELSSRGLRLQPTLSSKGSPVGLGVVEAPRGLLIHYYEVSEDLRVARADIITPTVMNTEHIELAATALVRRLLEDGADDLMMRKLVESLVRAYDPCIPCAVHVIRRR